ncbi:hypothetical protein [Methylophaga sp. OBS3]|uniref:hypothetical protein n=1 Tax=Methylophaga sp. OBS3 TaxID=2991934 RepID=UPI002259327F|nr:hypothetical protein [Methylophaga sp. OBS3]MCX4188956.1 hypothetical protein [Methylophaga sp. OBS3]
MHKIVLSSLIAGLLVSTAAIAQPPPPEAEMDNQQCLTISALAGDYYHHKQAGKTKEEVQQTLRPEFMNDEFIRMIDLAINLAYTFPDGLPETEVEAKVYEGCEKHQTP